MGVAIKVENLSKIYRLGEIGTGTISRDLERWYARMRGKEDPFLKIGETNDRTQKGSSDIVWSLKDINFEIEQSSAVGIIGRNGAGKSTLLKVLSRVTSPTTGRITGKGRIASLLEVGTGFHPELTGRENIYLNGAILGMRKKEITLKFDEIVDFAGIERYIDTPVKRYSSGMYVRLAFAVAAHLESEILIVDEVLAVGDAEFQKKCLGKMGDVSKGEGRTVLFVSHNMGSIAQLCNQAIVLENGTLKFNGNVKDSISYYLNTRNNNSNYKALNPKPSIYINEVFFGESELDRTSTLFNKPVYINILFASSHNVPNNTTLTFYVKTALNDVIFAQHIPISKESAKTTLILRIPPNLLLPSTYIFDFILHVPNVEFLDKVKDVLEYEIEDSGSDHSSYKGEDFGNLFIPIEYSFM